MNKAKAIQLIEKQIRKLENLKKFRYDSPEITQWETETRFLLIKIFGKNSHQLNEFEFAIAPKDLRIGISEAEEQRDYVRRLSDAKSVLLAIKTELKEFDIHENSEKDNPFLFLERIFNRFHKVVRQLRDRYNDRKTLDVKDEYDVQDLLHALLKLFFDDVRTEEWTPSYAGGAARMDFLLKDEKIVIEVKKAREGLGDKQIGDQLLQDIERYRNHPDCRHLVCFVYDPEGKIGNPRGLEADLSKEEEDFKVSVYVRPQM